MRQQPIFLLLAAVCLMAACTHKKTTAEGEAAVSPTETVKAIYEDLLPHYLSGEAMHETEWSAEKKYCSQEWLRRREADMAEASQTGNASAIDYDPWLSAQDWDTDLALYDVTLEQTSGGRTIAREAATLAYVSGAGGGPIAVQVRGSHEWEVFSRPRVHAIDPAWWGESGDSGYDVAPPTCSGMYMIFR